MKKNIISIIGHVLCAGILLITACTKMDHYYKDYAIERIHIGKPDSIWIQPGNYRLQIGMLTPQDPAAKYWVIHYEGDSIELPIDREAERQSTIIENLEEREYIFNIYTHDGADNKSLFMELSAPVFGDNYKSVVKQRSLSHSVVFKDSIALIWNTVGETETLFGSEIEFTDYAGQKQRILTPLSSISVVQNADPNQPISAKAVYRPHADAFEYYYSEEMDVDLLTTKRNSVTLKSSAWTDADYIDFNFVRVFQETAVPRSKGKDIDIVYTLGAGTRSNLFTMDGTGFQSFASDWQSLINAWAVRNTVNMKLDRTPSALTLYDGLDETDRIEMSSAYENSLESPLKRISGVLSPTATVLRTNDIIFLHSIERELYVAIKVISTPPPISGVYGELVLEFKISRP